MPGARGVVRFSFKRAGEMAEKIRFPLIIKSVDGVGCEDVNFITNTALLQFIHWTTACRQHQSGTGDPGRPNPRGSPARSVSITQPGQAGIED
jgi:biotin carboxylase